MDIKAVDEQRWPLLADQGPDDEERLLKQPQQQYEFHPSTPSRSQNIRRAIACTAKGVVLVGVSLFLLAGVGRGFVERGFGGSLADTDFDAVVSVSPIPLCILS